jgi:hypothetical protein
MSTVSLKLNPVNIEIHNYDYNYTVYTVYSPRHDLIVRKTVEFYDDGFPEYDTTYTFIEIKCFPEIKTVFFCSMYHVSFLVSTRFDCTTTKLDIDIEKIIRDITRIDEEYIVTDSLEILYAKRAKLRRDYVESIHNVFPIYDIAEKIFEEHMSKDIPCFKEQLENILPLQREQFLNIITGNVNAIDKWLDYAYINKYVCELMQYIRNMNWKPWKFYQSRTAYKDTYIETLIKTK